MAKQERFMNIKLLKSKEIIPYANDDFVAMIEIFLDDKKETLNGLKFRLFELEFTLYLVI